MKPLNLGDIQVGGAVDLTNQTNKDCFFMAMYLHSCNSENKTMLRMVIQSQTELLGHFHDRSKSFLQSSTLQVFELIQCYPFLTIAHPFWDKPQPYAVHANKLEYNCHQENV